ncbi:DUF2868 domain-containing protein [uncultured Marinobacter sp.]|jgi:hypothetical protein|uniref:DUF2868 domain-containing protein n=1 Tax=uncultured Marinobacter sp. TaxID=187379 RepID=UPI000C09455E|nr:hypothetical protein [Marinobacter sp.]MBI43950.1 hypothetical protein [Oceanospirillales bacterium]
MTPHPLRLLLDFDQRAQRDGEQPPDVLHRRDRRFALDCQQRGVQPTLERWLTHQERLSGPGAAPASQRLLRRWRGITAGFAGAGAVLGIVAMAGLLFYDGSQRINVTVILAFVLLQLALALATTLQAVIGWQPWRWLGRRLRLPDAPPVHARLRPLFMARAAQAGGTAFALSALATLLILVVVEDLAFGWSSTLTLASDRYLALVRALASPWGWLWPQAVPTRELVEGTRFFRAGPGPEATDPALWGQWWPFVTLLWCTWVLLPRLSLLVFSHWLLRWRASGLLARHPARQALLRRMANPTIDSGHDQAGDGLLPEPPAGRRPGPVPASDLAIAWAGAAEPRLPSALARLDGRYYRAGGRASLAEDDAVLAEVGTRLDVAAPPPVLVLTRGWEPPTGELQDFLLAARAQWPGSARVVLVPLADPSEPAPGQRWLAPWQRFAERLPTGFATVAVATGDTATVPE